MTNPPYSDAEITTLRALWGYGHSTREIGRRMHRSKNSVISKAHKIGLPARPSPIKRDPNAHPVVREPRVVREPPQLPPLVSVARMPLQQHQWAALSSRPPQPPAPNVAQLRLSIAAPRACQYPLWGALHADDRPVFGRMASDPRPGLSPRFCGVPAAVGCSYCKRHVAITHRKVAEVAA